MPIVLISLAVSVALLMMLPEVCAESEAEVSSGDIGWILVCSAMVFIMSPGVALFYGGMIRKQSMTSVMAQTAVVMGIMTVSWIAVGYTLAFSGDVGGLIGNLDKVLLEGVGYGSSGSSIPEMEFVLFQMMFSLITASIVLGACMERVRFNAIALFIAVWSVLVYAPMAHWVWGGGLFDQNLIVLDFAGGTVVHLCAATTGLVLALFVGARSSRVTLRGHGGRQRRGGNDGRVGRGDAVVGGRPIPPCRPYRLVGIDNRRPFRPRGDNPGGRIRRARARDSHRRRRASSATWACS